MYKIAFFCIPAYGHTNPTLEVVRELTRRGNEVWYFSFAEFRDRIEAAGAHFIGCDNCNLPMNAKPEDDEKVGKDIAFSIHLLVSSTIGMDEFVCKHLKKIKPDCVIADSMASWGKFSALKLGIPFISSTTTFAFNKYSAKIMKQSASSFFSMIKSMPSINRDIKRMQEKGYPVKNMFSLIGNSNDTYSIVYTSKEFQPASETFSERYAFVGPSIRQGGTPKERPKGKTIYISLGTVNNRRPKFYSHCIKAFQDTPYHVVMSVGKNTDITKLGKIPDNFEISNSVEQIQILQYADVFLSHCGMNSVNEGLYYTVPLVLFPQTTEQGGVAQRVSDLKAGLYLKEDSPEGIKKTVENVLKNPVYKENAAKIAKSFRRAGGAKMAADVIVTFLDKSRVTV